MNVILTSPFTLLLVLTIITVWHYQKPAVLTELKLPYSITDGMEVEAPAINIPLKANPNAAIYYTINGIKRSALADHEGYFSIYHYFDTDKLEVIIYADKYENELKSFSLYKGVDKRADKFERKVFDKPYNRIIRETNFKFFIEDDYILLNIDSPVASSELEEYVAYLLADNKYKLDLLKEVNNTYNTILRVNNSELRYI